MKIAAFSINPVYPNLVTGGASKHLFHIASQMGIKGHEVAIYCAQTEETKEPFSWSKNVMVFPILPFNLPFPQPYNLSGPDLALITERLKTGIRDADRFYIHDGEWLIPDIYREIPTISSFRDNIYPESVLGTFITKADEVICVSPFSEAVIKKTAGRFFPDLNKRIHQVNNGIDFQVYKPRDPRPLARELGVDLERDLVLLHPHRPEPGKGLSETVRVAGQLVNQHGMSNLQVLVPRWIEEMVSGSEEAFYTQIMRLIQELGVGSNIHFIPWLPNNRMPELYSLGSVTLCLGNIVEAFGNVAYESLACGTPSIVVRVGVHRTMMPDNLIAKVHQGDTEATVNVILDIVHNQVGVSPSAVDFLHTHMDFQRQIDAYESIIAGCSKRDPMQFVLSATGKDPSFGLAPWCYIDGERVYHDFRGCFQPEPELAGLFSDLGVITPELAFNSGVSQSLWDSWIERTLIIPIDY